jgi:amino acid adenylation domain-containing protein/thioester reductase-like protein
LAELRHPLTIPQQNIWNLQQYYPGTSIANVGGMIRFASAYDYPALNRAVNLLIENNDALRLRFAEENGQPYQIVTPYQPEQIAEYDMRGKSQNEVDAFFTALAQEPITHDQPAMYRFAAVNLDGGQCGVFVCASHMICDAWSMSVMAKEVVRYYQQELSGVAAPNPMPSYLDAVTSEQNYTASSRYEKDKAYWDAAFAEKPQLCRIKDVKETRDTATARYTHQLDSAFCQEMETFCKRENSSPAVLFEAALLAYLHRINEFASPVTIGIPVLNRSNAVEKKTIGMFISTMLLSVPVEEAASMAELCQIIKSKHMESFRHQKYPISHILQSIRAKDADASSLRDVMVSYQNARIDGLGIDVTATWYPNGHSEVPLCVHIEDMGNTGGYKLHFDYQTAVLSASEVAMLCDRLMYILRQTVDNGAVKVRDIQIVAPAEYQRVIHDFNDTAIEYPKEKCVHQLFEELAKETPDTVAVIFEGEEYTYRQINEMANALAHVLREKGIGRNDIVAIIAKRSYKIIVAQFATLKAGGAYLPIDPNYPKDRIAYMLDDAKCKVALTFGVDVGIDAISLDGELSAQSNNLTNINSPDDLCYVIYTSGSTGLPKGTMLTHQNVANYNNNNNNVVSAIIKPHMKTIISITTIGFDIFVTESLLPLCNGMTILFANDKQANDQGALNELILDIGADVLQATPSKMQLLMMDGKQIGYLKRLKAIILGGEALDPQIIEKLKGFTDANIYNIYGPTETTVWSSKSPVWSANNSTIHQLFEEQVERTPDTTALIACDDTHSFAELNQRANRIANALIEKGVIADDVIALVLPRRSYYITAMLGILKAAGAYLPLDVSYPKDRISYLLNDSGAKLVITTPEYAEKCEFDGEVMYVNDLLSFGKASNPNISINKDSLFCSLHTSGSTGKPKVLGLTHRNASNFYITAEEMFDGVEIALSTTIVSFDVFMQETLCALAAGIPIVFFSEQEINNQRKFEAKIEQYKNCYLFQTPTRLEHYIKNSETKKWLQSIRTFICGGEVFPSTLFELIHRYNNNNNTFNTYGPSECTPHTTAVPLSQWKAVNVYGPAECYIATTTTTTTKNYTADITIGRPIANTQIYILDKNLNPLPIGAAGELCISGDGVGRGYLNRPELTAEKFVPNPFIEGKRMYKTGDLARWREDGQLEYIGRMDNQVKIRGLRIELGEIEAAMVKYAGIKQTAVVDRKDENGRQYICAYYISDGEVDEKALRTELVKTLPRYMVPHFFTRLEAFPTTPSGKTDRKAFPSPDFTQSYSDAEYIEPVTAQEKALIKVLETVLGVSPVGMGDDFFDLGGDSLKAIEFAAKMERDGFTINVQDILGNPGIMEIASRMQAAVSAEKRRAVFEGDIPATPAQTRVYTAQSVTADMVTYNMPLFLKAKQPIDAARLENACKRLIERHDALRTHFERKDGAVIQVVNEAVEFSLCRGDLQSPAGAHSAPLHTANPFVRPFDLSQAPLLRVKLEPDTLMIDMHHIISDGGSLPVFLRELAELYDGKDLSAPDAQYIDFTADVIEYAKTEKYAQDKAYWLDVFSGELPTLSLMPDKSRPGKQSYKGHSFFTMLGDGIAKQVQANAKKLNITPFSYLLGGFYILLSKYSSDEDIVIGTPVSGRESARYMDAMGMFVNTLALRNRPVGSKSAAGFLREVSDSVKAAIEHQNYPFEDLVKELDVKRDTGHSPVFDVMIAYQSEKALDIMFGGEKLEPLPFDSGTAKYDLTLNLFPRGNDMVVMAEYCTDLWQQSSIDRMIENYKTILSNMAQDMDSRIEEISCLSPAEYQRVIHDFNDTAVEYPSDKCVHQLFEEQAARTPDTTALIACDDTHSFAELNQHANRIANALIEKGVVADDVIALVLPRRSYYIAAMFGILKSGGAYLPLDVDYPRERISFLLSDSRTKLVITTPEYAEKTNFDGKILLIDDLLTCKNAVNPNVTVSMDNLFCALHTSGSTGTPKVAGLTHGNVNNFMLTAKPMFGGVETALSTTTVSFDVFMQETMLALACGIQVVFFNEQEINDQRLFESRVEQHENCYLFQTPTRLESYIKNSLTKRFMKHIRTFNIGGEVFSSALYDLIQQYNNKNNTINVYGPTENTPYSAIAQLSKCGSVALPRDFDITIGRPIANTQIYILDKNLNPLPIGAVGELCISGDGVGRGYLNRPELTAEKFVPNPFIEGKRMYKTSDLARWREDGQLEYIGRMDNQVKIRGLRIELGEIEAAMAKFAGIKQAAVVDRKDETGRQYICAYYVSDGELDEKALRTELAKTLPRYMVPHFFTRLEAFPTTPSGKTDRKAFPSPDFTQSYSDAEYIAPVTEQEKALITVLETVLGVSPVGMGDDFFDLGGDSLKAIEFAAKAHSDGICFALQNVFDYPTPAALLECMASGDKMTVQYTAADFEKFDAILRRNQIDEAFTPVNVDMGNLFLTGATGFLGAHILDAYLRSGAGTAYCLVRGGSDEDARTRLADTLAFYFGDTYKDEQRIVTVRGDITGEFAVDADIHTVIHSAATVKHYGSYKYFYDMNVVGTKNVIDFSKQKDARLIHISTLSVSGNSFADDFSGSVSGEEKHFYESSLFIDQPFDNVYGRSKYEAEVEVLNAMLDGLKANIVRVGNLTNRYSDARFQINYTENAFLQRVKAVLEFGLFPDYLLPLYAEFSPVDYAANAVIRIARHFNHQYNVFHVNSNKPLYFDRMFELLKIIGINMKVVDAATFTQALLEAARQAGTEYIYEALMNDMDSDNRLVYESNIRIENDFTAWYLNMLGFDWPEVDVGYLTRYVEYFREIGLLGV